MLIPDYNFIHTKGNDHSQSFQNAHLNLGKGQENFTTDSLVLIKYPHKKNLHSEVSPNMRFYPIKENIEKMEEPSFSKPFNSKPPILNSKTSKAAYLEKVSRLKSHIQAGDIYEINFCLEFFTENFEINPFSVFERLNKLSEAPYSCLAKLDDEIIISASPELFLRKEGNTLFTKPIKGTSPRGESEQVDNYNKTLLQNSLKEKTENVMIVDVARNDLSRLAAKGTVAVDKLFDIESYKTVHQMVSTVSCTLKKDTGFQDIIQATFPMPSMTGAPKIRAMELIDDYEDFVRDAYSGAIGFIDSSGNFTLSVLIRSIFYNIKTKRLSFCVGSAITHLCDPEKEYEECLLKAEAMLKALKGVLG